MSPSFQAVLNFLSSDTQHTFALTGMTQTGKTDLLRQIAEHLSRNGQSYVILSPNMRLAKMNTIDTKSIYQHLYTSLDTLPIQNLEPDTFQLEAPNEKISTKTFSLRANQDGENCVYLLDNAHLLSNTSFTTPDGKKFGSGKLLDDLFKFIDFENSKRKAIFFGDPYQIQRSDILIQCQNSYALPLPAPNSPDLSGKLKMVTHLAHALHQHHFAYLPFIPDSQLSIQADNTAAAQEILSYYQNDNPVWFLTETHGQTMRFNQWLRSKLHLAHSLDAGDWLEIYVWHEENKTVFSGSLERVLSVQASKPNYQKLKGREKPIKFHTQTTTLSGNAQQDVLLEFLISEKPELDAEMATAVNVWQKNQSKKEEKEEIVSFAYARYGYSATVHHAQGMKRKICYINCAHSAGKHSEGYFRWLYSALTVATEKTVLLNFTPTTPFDQIVWKVQEHGVQSANQIVFGAGWILPEMLNNNEFDFSSCLQMHFNQIANSCQCHFIHQSSHPYLEKYCIETEQGKFDLQVFYKGNYRISRWQHNASENQYDVLIKLAIECTAQSPYTPIQKMLLNHLRQALPDWKLVSVIPENEYRLNITLLRQWQERVQFKMNFGEQGIVSSIHILAMTDISLAAMLKEKLV
ncbi:hypothetical protein [Conchiformibius steedae]|uniref:Uncharacterized protein n=1 Tax=Conchiformibius steedae TaxID=153493 RepID=A0A3P2A6V7_9NEIS|nr:hypothetical protein [Conchiformibius steedae]RRD91124.1 hypothetical protein EII21_01640 [Conchiformibius steedae]